MSLPMILGAGQIFSTIMSNSANNKALSAQKDATQQQIALQREQFNRTANMTQPARATANNALAALAGSARSGVGTDIAGTFQRKSGQLVDQADRRAQRAGDNYERRTDFYLDNYRDQSGKLVGRANQQQDRVIDQYGERSGQAYNTLRDSLSSYETAARSRMDVARDNFGQNADAVRERTFEEDPGYQFRLEQGEKALERGAAARGNVFSGATMQALNDFNSGLASQEYGAWDARKARDYGVELGRDVTEYGMDYGAAQDYYGRNANRAGTAYGAKMDRAGTLLDAGYQAAGDEFSRGMGRMNSLTGMKLGQADSLYGNDMNFAQGSFDRQYGRRADVTNQWQGAQQDYRNTLATLAGYGPGATSQAASAGSAFANNAGNALSNLAGYTGQAATANANNWAGALEGGANILTGMQGGMFGASPGFGINPSPTGLKMWGYA